MLYVLSIYDWYASIIYFDIWLESYAFHNNLWVAALSKEATAISDDTAARKLWRSYIRLQPLAGHITEKKVYLQWWTKKAPDSFLNNMHIDNDILKFKRICRRTLMIFDISSMSGRAPIQCRVLAYFSTKWNACRSFTSALALTSMHSARHLLPYSRVSSPHGKYGAMFCKNNT